MKEGVYVLNFRCGLYCNIFLVICKKKKKIIFHFLHFLGSFSVDFKYWSRNLSCCETRSRFNLRHSEVRLQRNILNDLVMRFN